MLPHQRKPQTVAERLAEKYPLHYQRIVENMNEQFAGDTLGLNLPARENELQCSFVWAASAEGHKYWQALSRAEEQR